MRFLSKSDLQSLLTMNEVIEAVREAFIELSSGRNVVPARINIPFREKGSDALVMPSYLPGKQLFGVKSITLVPSNPGKRNLPLGHALFTLFNAENGLPLAVMDAEYLTAMRTGAASGVATGLLSRETAESVAIFGAGMQGRFQLRAVAAVRRISSARVFDPDPGKAEKFAEEMSGELKINVAAGKESEELKEADIICTATTSLEPVFEHKYLKETVHINGIGSYRPDMREIPFETVGNAGIYVDSRAAALSEAGDLIQALDRGVITPDSILAEIGEIAAGGRKAYKPKRKITFFKSVGNALQDLVTADLALRKAEKAEKGIIAEL